MIVLQQSLIEQRQTKELTRTLGLSLVSLLRLSHYKLQPFIL